MKKIKEILDMSSEKLDVRLNEIAKELYKLRTELKINHKLEKPHLLKDLKKEKAKILTVLTMRKNNG